MKNSATARVTVTLELDSDSSWGSNCSLEQIYNQAREGVVNRVHNALYKGNEYRNLKIIDTKVTAIWATEEK